MDDDILQVCSLTVALGGSTDAAPAGANAVARLTPAEQAAARHPVRDVSWSLPRGQTLALVGESGCGKSLTALALMGLLPAPAVRVARGEVWYRRDPQAEPVDLLQLPPHQLRRFRGKELAIVFQEPMTALNPVYTVGDQLLEVLHLHRQLAGDDARYAASALLQDVGVPAAEDRLRDYPHQFSGGMRQRVLLAMALAGEPRVLIADEPTTALDVTIQAEILALLRRRQQRDGLSIVLITHDLAVVAQLADRVGVMYAGRLVELAPTASLFDRPMHPYTQGLMRCLPRLGEHRDRLASLPGQVPELDALPRGCAFHPRCSLTQEHAGRTDAGPVTRVPNLPHPVLQRCVQGQPGRPEPALREVSPGHWAACWEVVA